jgi:hypothetical protein
LATNPERIGLLSGSLFPLFQTTEFARKKAFVFRSDPASHIPQQGDDIDADRGANMAAVEAKFAPPVEMQIILFVVAQMHEVTSEFRSIFKQKTCGFHK